MEAPRARDEYFEETGIYIPICSDGGIVHDYHITLCPGHGRRLRHAWADILPALTRALQRGSNVNGSYMKEYWGEGSKSPQLAEI